MPPGSQPPFVVAVTGGIGVGKSTVSGVFADCGATLVDADAIARDVVAPGTPGLAEIAHHFGDDVLAADGSLNRQALANIVFADDAALRQLEQITHPKITQRTADLIAAATTPVVVHDIPLLTCADDAAAYDLVVLVTADRVVRLTRLQERGLSRDDAERRMANQVADATRRQFSDHEIDNSGEKSATVAHAQQLWADTILPAAQAAATSR